MSECMVAKVVSAIRATYYRHSYPVGDGDRHVPDPGWDRIARAAIEAMRRPSGEVHRAGHSPLVPYFAEEADAYGHSQRVWEAMIDAALQEKKG